MMFIIMLVDCRSRFYAFTIAGGCVAPGVLLLDTMLFQCVDK